MHVCVRLHHDYGADDGVWLSFLNLAWAIFLGSSNTVGVTPTNGAVDVTRRRVIGIMIHVHW